MSTSSLEHSFMVKSCVVVVCGGLLDYTVSFLGLAIAIPISRPRPRSLTILESQKIFSLSQKRLSAGMRSHTSLFLLLMLHTMTARIKETSNRNGSRSFHGLNMTKSANQPVVLPATNLARMSNGSLRLGRTQMLLVGIQGRAVTKMQ